MAMNIDFAQPDLESSSNSSVLMNGHFFTLTGPSPSAISIVDQDTEVSSTDVEAVLPNDHRPLSPSQFVTNSSNLVVTNGDSHSIQTDKCSAKKSTSRISLSQLISEPIPQTGTTNVALENVIEGIDSYQSTSLTDVTAFLNMPSSVTTQVSTNGLDADSGLRILDSSNGILHLVDNSGRIYAITPDNDPSISISITNSASNMETFSIDSQEQITAAELAHTGNQVEFVLDSHGTMEHSQQVPDTPRSRKRKQKKQRAMGLKNKGGWPKGKKRKEPEYSIKAPSSAYVIFARKRRKEIMKEFPYYTFSEVTRIMGKEWTEMDFDLKDDYNKKADDDKKRFREELKTYQQSEEYQKILKRKKEERKKNGKDGAVDDDDNLDEEMMLYCRICDQRFSNRHNRAEHLAGKVHLNNLQTELRKQNTEAEKIAKESSKHCCKHCVRKIPNSATSDVSIDINNMLENFVYKHSQREMEIKMLKDNLQKLKDVNNALSKELISLQDTQEKLRQDVQSMRDLSTQLTQDIDNLKMVPTLFGVINF